MKNKTSVRVLEVQPSSRESGSPVVRSFSTGQCADRQWEAELHQMLAAPKKIC